MTQPASVKSGAVFERVTAYLEQNAVPYAVLAHAPAETAEDIARAEDVSPHEIAKTVVVRVGKRYRMVVVPAPHHVDLHRIVPGRQVRLATEEELAALFPGCEVGAMPPFGNLFGLPVHVDSCLARDEYIAFHAGSHTRAVRVAYADFARLVHPVVDDYTRLPGDE